MFVRILITFGLLFFFPPSRAEKADDLKNVLYDTSILDDQDVDSSKILTGSCNTAGKVKTIDDRYLEESSITVTGKSNRRWKVDRIYRDVFKEGTDIQTLPLNINCLYDLLKLSVKETAQNAHDLNIKNRCFKNLESLQNISRDQKPDACPEDAWQETIKTARILQQLEDSIKAQEREVALLQADLKKIGNETEAGCLNCLNKCLAKAPGIAQSKDEAKKIQKVMCCDVLVKKKYIADESKCSNYIDGYDVNESSLDKSKEDVKIESCASKIVSGLWKGVESLDPRELIHAVPALTELMKELAVGNNRVEVLKVVLLGLLKGVTGFEPDVWGCFNSKAKFSYACEIVGQTAFSGAAVVGFLKILSALKSGSMSVAGVSNLAEKLKNSTLALKSMDLVATIKDHKVIAKVASPENIAKLKNGVSTKFDELAESYPTTFGRLNSYYEALQETGKKAKEIVLLDVAIVEAKKTGADLADLAARRATAAAEFEASQKSLSLRMSTALKAGAFTLGQKSLVGAPLGAAPLSDHVKATESPSN